VSRPGLRSFNGRRARDHLLSSAAGLAFALAELILEPHDYGADSILRLGVRAKLPGGCDTRPPDRILQVRIDAGGDRHADQWTIFGVPVDDPAGECVSTTAKWSVLAGPYQRSISLKVCWLRRSNPRGDS
jgi:hypothetical protein